MRYRTVTFLILIIIAFISCKKGKELKTESGLKYILYTESTGTKAKIGDYVTLELVYRNNNDSVLFDSRDNKIPIRFRLEKIPFVGSFEEALTYLSANDSATVFVPADSLYKYLHKSGQANIVRQKESVFTPGSFLKFEIKLLKIQGESEAEEEMVFELSKKDRQEQIDLANYLRKIKITAPQDSTGYNLIMIEKGNGPSVDSGKVVTVEYEGRFLNDSVFDGTKNAGHPYKFISGAHHVIKGWEMAMKEMHAGDRFTLILPSKLAFGEEGIHDPKNGMYIVPPYAPLLYDIKIISVEDTPPVSSK